MVKQIVQQRETQKNIKMINCSICGERPPRIIYYSNSLCRNCFEGAKTVMAGLNKMKPDRQNPSEEFAKVLKCLNPVGAEDNLNEKLSFLGGYSSAYRNQVHCDIQLKPGDNGPSIPAHRALLATRSDIFKNMLDFDRCKASEPSETITFHEMSYNELESMLEFLYCGELPKEKVEKNLYALTRAAHKYEILYLQKYCEMQMCQLLNKLNVLDVLEISDKCCNQNLKETALNFIIEHGEDLYFSDMFDHFAVKNPQLTVQILRATTNRKTTV